MKVFVSLAKVKKYWGLDEEKWFCVKLNIGKEQTFRVIFTNLLNSSGLFLWFKKPLQKLRDSGAQMYSQCNTTPYVHTWEAQMMATIILQGAEALQPPCSSVSWASKTSRYILILLGPVKDTVCQHSLLISMTWMELVWQKIKRLSRLKDKVQTQFLVFLYLIPNAYYSLQTFSVNQVSLLS